MYVWFYDIIGDDIFMEIFLMRHALSINGGDHYKHGSCESLGQAKKVSG